MPQEPLGRTEMELGAYYLFAARTSVVKPSMVYCALGAVYIVYSFACSFRIQSIVDRVLQCPVFSTVQCSAVQFTAVHCTHQTALQCTALHCTALCNI